jgi:hypothetical protein
MGHVSLAELFRQRVHRRYRRKCSHMQAENQDETIEPTADATPSLGDEDLSASASEINRTTSTSGNDDELFDEIIQPKKRDPYLMIYHYRAYHSLNHLK